MARTLNLLPNMLKLYSDGENFDMLEKYNINFTLEGRVKTVYSIYRKMYNQSKDFDEIYDFYAVRIIVETELECYTSLGLVHEMFKSIPGRFKDYISTPKDNQYRSLHTTVIGRDGIPFEVHVYSAHRTPEECAGFVKEAANNGFGVIIAAAGMAAHLAGAIAANTTLPVVGIPCKSSNLDGM